MTAALSSLSGTRARQQQNQFHSKNRPSSGRIENDKTTSPRRSVVVVQNAKTSSSPPSSPSVPSSNEKEEELWLALG
jgi:hypothetical protein